jgi:hypothetical protein
MSEVRAAHNWPTNGHMIAEVAMLGYLDGEVLDTTCGEAGGFWKQWRPSLLVTNDYDPDVKADNHWDARRLPLPDCSFDSVVFDPPYKLKGTPALGEQDRRFGTDKKTTRNEVLDLLLDGARECHRVCRSFVLVKCQDMVEGGKIRWQTEKVTQLLALYGARKVDEFMFMGGGRPQPEGRTQRTAYYRPSTLLVFAKTEKDPRP